MIVNIRPAGYICFALALIALVFRLLYTLLVGDHIALPKMGKKETAPAATTTAANHLPESAKLLTDWVALAPIPSGITLPSGDNATEATMNQLLNTAYVSNEGQLNPHDGETITVSNDQHTWRTVKEGTLNLNKIANQEEKKPEGTTYNNAVAYAVTTVHVPKDVPSATLYLGSDDGVAVWLNGNKIHQNATIRGTTAGSDKVTKLPLKAGDNTFIFKVGNGNGDWGMTASLDLH